jgi:hypothetical protein
MVWRNSSLVAVEEVGGGAAVRWWWRRLDRGWEVGKVGGGRVRGKTGDARDETTRRKMKTEAMGHTRGR